MDFPGLSYDQCGENGGKWNSPSPEMSTNIINHEENQKGISNWMIYRV